MPWYKENFVTVPNRCAQDKPWEPDEAPPVNDKTRSSAPAKEIYPVIRMDGSRYWLLSDGILLPLTKQNIHFV